MNDFEQYLNIGGIRTRYTLPVDEIYNDPIQTITEETIVETRQESNEEDKRSNKPDIIRRAIPLLDENDAYSNISGSTIVMLLFIIYVLLLNKFNRNSVPTYNFLVFVLLVVVFVFYDNNYGVSISIVIFCIMTIGGDGFIFNVILIGLALCHMFIPLSDTDYNWNYIIQAILAIITLIYIYMYKSGTKIENETEIVKVKVNDESSIFQDSINNHLNTDATTDKKLYKFI